MDPMNIQLVLPGHIKDGRGSPGIRELRFVRYLPENLTVGRSEWSFHHCLTASHPSSYDNAMESARRIREGTGQEILLVWLNGTLGVYTSSGNAAS